MVIAYFGCWNEPGHYLKMPGNRKPYSDEQKKLPSPGHLDGSILFLPRPEKVGVGAITYLPGPNLTVLAWWGSPFDRRGAVNSAVIVSGHVRSLDAIWGSFEKHFPELAGRLRRPEITEDRS